MKYYNIYIWRGVEPRLLGPYQDTETRATKARKFWKRKAQPEYDSIFKLDIDDSRKPTVSGYSAADVEKSLGNSGKDEQQRRFVPWAALWYIEQRKERRTYMWSGGDMAAKAVEVATHGAYYNLCIWDMIEIQLAGPYPTFDKRLEAAQDFWRRVGDSRSDAIFRLNIDEGGKPDIDDFAGVELADPEEVERTMAEYQLEKCKYERHPPRSHHLGNAN